MVASIGNVAAVQPVEPNPSPADVLDAVARFATGVTVVGVRDDMDDVATTVSAFLSVSHHPPLVAIAVAADGYLAEVLERRDRWGVSVLAAHQKALAGRFAASGRPSARLLLADHPHHRGAVTGALLLDDALAALECRTVQRVAAGDHLVVIAAVLAVAHVHTGDEPLVRHGRSYRAFATPGR